MPVLPIAQLASVAGVYGVSFLVVLVAACLALWATARDRSGLIAAGAAAETAALLRAEGETVTDLGVVEPRSAGAAAVRYTGALAGAAR